MSKPVGEMSVEELEQAITAHNNLIDEFCRTETSIVLGLQKRLDELVAAESVKQRLKNMNPEERAALAKLLAAPGIPPGQVGEPGK